MLAYDFVEGVVDRDSISAIAIRLKELSLREADSVRKLYFSDPYSFHELPDLEEDVIFDLMREVLGNPFLPVEFLESWKSPDVLTLAASIYDGMQFERMPELARMLETAGCEDARVLLHCRRTVGHARGGWVLDELLQKEPRPEKREFHWDYSWPHPTIPEVEIKSQMAKFGVGRLSPEEFPRAALTFADWVETHGDILWANYIRTCCKLEGSASSEDFVTQAEEYLEANLDMTFLMTPRIQADFGDFDRGRQEFGLPTGVTAVRFGRGARPIQLLTQQWEELVHRTPVRGLNIGQNYSDEMDHFFQSPGAQHLRSFHFWNRSQRKDASPVISSLVTSSAARSLERLVFDASISDGDAATLASASFERLHTLTVSVGSLDSIQSAALTGATWFRKLRSLKITLEGSQDRNLLRNLSQMPLLESLTVYDP